MFNESGLTVIKKGYEDIESLLKRFKRKVTKSGILKDLRYKEFYEKPSVKQTRKSREARKRLKKDQSKHKFKPKMEERK